MRQNVGDYPRVYELAQRIGASFQADQRVTPRIDGDPSPLRFQINEADLSLVLADPIFNLQPRDGPAMPHSNGIFDDLPCGAAHTACYISPYGDVFPCIQLPVLCGNLKEKSFEEIWYHSPEMLKVRSITIPQLPVCSQCDLLPYCNRCPGLAYMEEGDLMAPSKRACREAGIKRDIKMKVMTIIIYMSDIYIISMKEKMVEKIGKKTEKRPYEKPAFGSEELFETAVLACDKISGGECTHGSIHWS